MAITQFSNGPKRRRVAFVGEMPQPLVEVLSHRGYEAYALTASDLSDKFCYELTCAVVLLQDLDAPHRVRAELKTVSSALNHDCRIYVRYAPSGAMKEILLRALNSQRLPSSGFAQSEDRLFYGDWFDPDLPFVYAPFVHLIDPEASWNEFANTIANNEAGAAPSRVLTIEATNTDGGQMVIDGEDDLLLRRAFHNCERVCLFGKTNGLSEVGAYEGYAYLRDSELGGHWPYKFFVKLGNRVKVAREFHKYGSTLLENVPFHLGPRLRRERCVLGKSRGVIVSDFVLGAETICESAREGRGVTAIANLFNVTLLPWRRAAKKEQVPLSIYLLEVLSDEKGAERAVPQHRTDRLSDFGATTSAADLIEMIEHMPPSTQVLIGMIHGDLHATNVLVRGHDAVVIDLERVDSHAPMLYDAASLEAGLFVDGFVKDPRSCRTILESVMPLYTVDAFRMEDHFLDPRDPSAWFFDCVRQIRMQAKQMELEPLQYAMVLGAVFIKKACNKGDFAKDLGSEHPVIFDRPCMHPKAAREAIRTLAYRVGERIILGLVTEFGTAPT